MDTCEIPVYGLTERLFIKSLTHWLKTSSFSRYIIIGFSAFVLDFSLLKLGLAMGLHLLLANGISVTLAIIYSFFAHRFFTFAHKAKTRGYSIEAKRQFMIFVVVSISALLLSELLISVLVHRLEFSASHAKIISSALLFIWNYGFNRVLTFKS